MDHSLAQLTRVSSRSRRRHSALGLLALASVLAAGCGDDDDADDPTPNKDAATETPDAAVSAYGDSLHVSITVPNVPAGKEGTQCVKVRLGNVGPVKISKIHNRLAGHSHHFVLSAIEDPASTEEPLSDCRPFLAPLTGAPLTVTQKHDEEIVLPDGVAYVLSDNQLMHLELHYINTSSETVDIKAEAELFPTTDTKPIQEAGFLVVGSLGIEIPPQSTHTSGDIYMPVPAVLDGVHYYAVTGHTHQLGTNVTVGMAENATAPAEPIYAPSEFDWSAPEVRYLDPPVQLPPGGGFRFKCDWKNPTDKTVLYGESALTEMCFFWAYYYPRSPKQQVLLHARDESMYTEPKK